MDAAMNLWGGWIAVLGGLLAGTAIGMFFHHERWLGGYGSWQRRMLRLSHISLVGTGLLNILFALSIRHVGMTESPATASGLFLAGAVAMPTVCVLSAWRPGFRHCFFLPVGCLVGAVGDFLVEGLTR